MQSLVDTAKAGAFCLVRVHHRRTSSSCLGLRRGSGGAPTPLGQRLVDGCHLECGPFAVKQLSATVQDAKHHPVTVHPRASRHHVTFVSQAATQCSALPPKQPMLVLPSTTSQRRPNTINATPCLRFLQVDLSSLSPVSPLSFLRNLRNKQQQSDAQTRERPDATRPSVASSRACGEREGVGDQSASRCPSASRGAGIPQRRCTSGGISNMAIFLVGVGTQRLMKR